MSESPTPEAAQGDAPALAASRRRSWRVGLLGLIGLLALLLPLAQVLRFQVESLHQDRLERTRLDPLAEAVSVQLGLIDHERAADRMLRGSSSRSGADTERRRLQAEVDRRLASLQATLWAGQWLSARREAAGLQGGWRQLCADIEQRSIGVDANQQSHRLLQEQAVQVMDLVQAGLALPWGRLPPQALHALVETRRSDLDRRIAGAETAMRWTGAALAGFMTLAAGWAMAWLRKQRQRRAVAAAAPEPRRSHGRRSSDRPPVQPPGEIAAAELVSIRRALEDERSGG